MQRNEFIYSDSHSPISTLYVIWRHCMTCSSLTGIEFPGSTKWMDIHDVLAILSTRIRHLQITLTPMVFSERATFYSTGERSVANDGGCERDSAAGSGTGWDHSCARAAGPQARRCRSNEAELLGADWLESWHLFLWVGRLRPFALSRMIGC